VSESSQLLLYVISDDDADRRLQPRQRRQRVKWATVVLAPTVQRWPHLLEHVVSARYCFFKVVVAVVVVAAVLRWSWVCTAGR